MQHFVAHIMSSSFLPLLSLSCKSIFHLIFDFPNTTIAYSRKFLSFSQAACPCSHLLCSACLLQSSVMALLAQAGPLIPPLIFLTVPRGCLEMLEMLFSQPCQLSRAPLLSNKLSSSLNNPDSLLPKHKVCTQLFSFSFPSRTWISPLQGL